jgi:carboxyl-terminal processing protease
MRRRNLALGTVLFVLVGAGAVFTLPPEIRHGAIAANAEFYRELERFGEVFDRVRSSYVDKPDDAKLIEKAINGMLERLDPHSSYLTPKEFLEEQDETRGEFGGLGIDVTMEEGVVKVVAPIANMPAERAGVLAGDAIVALDGQPLRGLSMNQAVEKMRGAVGVPITLTIDRSGVSKPVTIRIVRDVIRINPVQYSVEGDVGWIKIRTFENEHTSDYLRQAVEDIKKTAGPALVGYVIDLRNNPGGLLVEAVAVSDDFLDRGVIVITKGRTASDIERSSAKPGDITDGKPLIVLINGGSASASEIVAGALQDHKRAILVGTRSFGKGSVQTMIPLANKGALRLTTARYYTPSGRSIQATGIEPDYVVEQDVPEEMKLQLSGMILEGEAGLRGHLKNESAAEAAGSLSYVPKEKEKDRQLQVAIELLHGKIPQTGKPSVEHAHAAPEHEPTRPTGAEGG